MRNVFNQKIASPSRRLVRKGISWNHADQLLPVDAEEEALEMELDEVPPGVAVTNRAVAVALMVTMVIVTEYTLLRAEGLMGPALFFPIVALLICIGIPGRSIGWHTVIVGLMLGAVSFRLATNGTWIHLAIAGWLLTALTLCFRHQKPFLLSTLMFGVESLYLGYEFFLSFKTDISRAFVPPDEDRSSAVFNYGLPAIVIAIVGIVALAMQPELLSQLGQVLDSKRVSVQTAAFTIFDTNIVNTGGLVFGRLDHRWFFETNFVTDAEVPSDISPMEDGIYHAPLFVPLRNTLITTIVIFGAFLIFGAGSQLGQSATTLALQSLKVLAVSTVLSAFVVALVFTGPNLADTRIAVLRKLSCGVLSLNILFALVVGYRTIQAIQPVGVSRFDIQQLLAVVSLIVLTSLAAYLIFVQQSLTWLVRRTGWIVGVAAFAYFVVVPVDRLVSQDAAAQIVDTNMGQISETAGSQTPVKTVVEIVQ